MAWWYFQFLFLDEMLFEGMCPRFLLATGVLVVSICEAVEEPLLI